jgi:ribosomal protein L37AE/L43A
VSRRINARAELILLHPLTVIAKTEGQNRLSDRVVHLRRRIAADRTTIRTTGELHDLSRMRGLPRIDPSKRIEPLFAMGFHGGTLLCSLQRDNRSMDVACEQCGATINRRAKANIWQGEKVVCTACMKDLQGAERRLNAAYVLAGKPGTAWTVRHRGEQYGPYPTDRLIELLRQGRVDWIAEIRRDGMKAWTPAARLFVTPQLANGRIELRDFGQGDGTYRPAGA